ncbi:hypothetical protein B5X24_HaOG200901 [Helicoverpa armigera]|nr:hypothetical protein B5X24_HaOG200901 [Helicoverpa armigera]
MALVKPVALIKLVMFIRLISGFYCKISSNSKINFLVKTYCILIATLIIFLTITVAFVRVNIESKCHIGFMSTLYIISVVTSICLNGDNFEDFLTKIRGITTLPNVESADKITFSIFLFFLSLCSRIVVNVKFTIDNVQSISDPLFYVSLVSLTLATLQYSASFTRIMMFELLCRRMVILRKRVESDLSIPMTYQAKEMVREKIRKCLHTYKSLLDTIRGTDMPMKFLVSFLLKNLIEINRMQRVYKPGVHAPQIPSV